jgi:hypothetical protein
MEPRFPAVTGIHRNGHGNTGFQERQEQNKNTRINILILKFMGVAARPGVNPPVGGHRAGSVCPPTEFSTVGTRPEHALSKAPAEHREGRSEIIGERMKFSHPLLEAKT